MKGWTTSSAVGRVFGRTRGRTIGWAATVLVGSSAASGAIVLNFDDLTGEAAVPAGYGGIANWGSWFHYDSEQPPYTPASGPTRIYDTLLNPTPIVFGAEYQVLGAAFSGFDGSTGQGGPLVMELYLGGVLQFTSAAVLPSAEPKFLPTGYKGFADELRIRTASGEPTSYGWFVMDDLTISPSPGVAALLVLAAAPRRSRR